MQTLLLGMLALVSFSTSSLADSYVKRVSCRATEGKDYWTFALEKQSDGDYRAWYAHSVDGVLQQDEMVAEDQECVFGENDRAVFTCRDAVRNIHNCLRVVRRAENDGGFSYVFLLDPKCNISGNVYPRKSFYHVAGVSGCVPQ